MKRVNSIPGTFFSALEERAGIVRFAQAIGFPTFKTQPESASPRLFKAAVLVGDFLSSVLLYILIPALRNSVNARWVQL